MQQVKLHGQKFASNLSASCHLRLPRLFGAAMLCAIFLSSPLSPLSNIAHAAEIEISSFEAAALASDLRAAQTNSPITRTISLQALGRRRGLQVGALNAASRFEFDLPAHAIVNEEVYAYLQLDQNLDAENQGQVLIIPASGNASRADLNGRVRNQALSVTLPVASSGSSGFSFDYSSNATCPVTQAGEATFAINSASSFTYDLNPAAVTNVADAAATLGDHVIITLPGEAISEEQFAAAFNLARALAEAGRTISFNQLPGASLQDTDLAFTLLAGMGGEAVASSLGDIVIASPAELGQLVASFEEMRASASRQSTELRRLLTGANLALETTAELALLRAGTRAVIAVQEPASAFELADLINHQNGESLSATEIGAEALSAQADISNPGARSTWSLPFTFADLPAGTLPDRFEFSLNPGTAADVAGQLLHVFLNDQLLRTYRLGDLNRSSQANVRQFSVGLPRNLLEGQNDLRLLLQRDATREACNESNADVVAQLLPTSGLTTALAAMRPGEFFELAPHLRGGVDIAVPLSAMADPQALLAGLLTLATNLIPAGTETTFHFVPEGMRFAPRGAFVLYGMEPAGLTHAPMRLDRGEVEINDHDGDLMLSLADKPNASVVQIIRARSHYGLWVNRPFDLGNDGTALNFERGNLAVVDANGIALWLNTQATRGLRLDYVDQHKIADFFAANRLFVLIGAWSLISLLMLRGIVSGRTGGTGRSKQEGEG